MFKSSFLSEFCKSWFSMFLFLQLHINKFMINWTKLLRIPGSKKNTIRIFIVYKQNHKNLTKMSILSDYIWNGQLQMIQNWLSGEKNVLGKLQALLATFYEISDIITRKLNSYFKTLVSSLVPTYKRKCQIFLLLGCLNLNLGDIVSS